MDDRERWWDRESVDLVLVASHDDDDDDDDDDDEI